MFSLETLAIANTFTIISAYLLHYVSDTAFHALVKKRVGK